MNIGNRRKEMKSILGRVIGVFLIVCIFSATIVLPKGADKKIAKKWSAKCASCHGATGKGDTRKGKKLKAPDMTTAAFQKITDDAIKNTISNGVKRNGKVIMPHYKDLKPELVNGLAGLIRHFNESACANPYDDR